MPLHRVRVGPLAHSVHFSKTDRCASNQTICAFLGSHVKRQGGGPGIFSLAPENISRKTHGVNSRVTILPPEDRVCRIGLPYDALPSERRGRQERWGIFCIFRSLRTASRFRGCRPPQRGPCCAGSRCSQAGKIDPSFSYTPFRRSSPCITIQAIIVPKNKGYRGRLRHHTREGPDGSG